MGSSDTDINAVQNTDQDDQNELSLAISKAVTQVLESSDWRSLSFPLDANAAKRSKAKNNVKRPMNAFMLYAQAARKKLSHLYPDLSYAKLSKTLGRIWKSLDDSEKQPFMHEAERLRQKHKIDHPDYKFQPKRKVKQTSNNSFDTGKISTGDVLKALNSTIVSTEKHDSQSAWAHSLQNGGQPLPTLSPLGDGSLNTSCYTKSNTPPQLYTTLTSEQQPKLTRSSPPTAQHFSPVPISMQATTLAPFQAHFFTPPPLQRSIATTAGLFTPASYRVNKPPPGHSVYSSQGNEYLNLTNNNTQTFAYDLPFHMQLANSYPKYQPPTSLSSQPPPLTPSHSAASLDQSGHLLTGVNQILRDMFGNDKSNVV